MERGGRGRGRGRGRVASAPVSSSDEDEEEEKKKKARTREDEEVEGEVEEEPKRQSQSRQWNNLFNGKALGKRQGRQATLAIALRVEAQDDGSASPAPAATYVPPLLVGSGLEVVNRLSERDASLAEAEKARQGGRENKKKGNQLDPAKMDGIKSACWVFFRTAREGEDPGFVYCRACEYIDNGVRNNAANRVAIAEYGTAKAHLHAHNAKSHLKQHKKWWGVVQDQAQKGMDPKAAFADLMAGQKRRTVQAQATLDGHLKKGQKQAGLVEKELRLVIWMVRNKISFNAVDDNSFKDLLQSFGVKLSSGKTLKRYLLLLSEIALRHAEKQIIDAGTYSIALDYWTSVAKDKYLAITYHYTDKDWNVRARVLDLVPVTGNSTGLLTSQLVEQRLDRHFEEKRRLFK